MPKVEMFIIEILIAIIIIQLIMVLKAKQELKKVKRVRKFIYEASEKIIDVKEESEAFKLILDYALNLVPIASKGSFLKYCENENEFEFISVCGYSKELEKKRIPKENIFLYRKNKLSDIAIIETKEVIRDKYSELYKISSDIVSVVCAPIYIDEKLVGVINLDNTNANKNFTNDDIHILKYILNEFKLVIKSQTIQSELRNKSTFDSLTSIYSRGYLKYLMEYYLENEFTTYDISSLVFIDINSFKYINDNYGHKVGDDILKRFAAILRNRLDDRSIYGRLGGDEFLIMFNGFSKKKTLEIIEEIEVLCGEICVGNYNLSFSYGIYEIVGKSEENLDLEVLISKADSEMYKQKRIVNRTSKYKIGSLI